MSALFILATAGLIFNARDIVNQLLWEVAGLTGVHNSGLALETLASMTPRYIMMILANIIADAILMWRCYIVWGGNIRVIILPTLLCIANNGIVVAIHYTKGIELDISLIVLYFHRGDKSFRMISAFLLMTALTNLLITFLIAGRIYVISRKAAKYVGKNVNKMYWTVITIILESGLMYPLVLIIYASSVLTVFNLVNMPAWEVQNRMRFLAVLLQSTLNQFVGIAPTLIIVRIGLGISVENVEQTVSAMRTAAVMELKQLTENIVEISPPKTGGHRFNDLVYSEDISAEV
ncbi:hypothetical protein Moror_5577 [Moniliophthora roreri MCA 2997]|nr:hypothetical protein Moror_5577 [Moniliophthora roreri MCA 2997]